MEHYKMLKHILENSSGFEWNGNKLTASDNTWDEMIMKKPGVKYYRDKSFTHDGVNIVSQDGVADGRASLTGAEVAEAIRSSNMKDGDVRTPLPPQAKRPRLNTTYDKCTDEDAITRIASAVEKFTETYAEASKRTPFTDILTALEETPDLTETDYSRAVTVLASNPKLADAFILLPCHRRVAWLRSTFR